MGKNLMIAACLALAACSGDSSDGPDAGDASHAAPSTQVITCVPHRYQSTSTEYTTAFRAELTLTASSFPRVWVKTCDRVDKPTPTNPCGPSFPCPGDRPQALNCTITAVATYAADGTFSYDCGWRKETMINQGVWVTSESYYPSVTVLVEP